MQGERLTDLDLFSSENKGLREEYMTMFLYVNSS